MDFTYLHAVARGAAERCSGMEGSAFFVKIASPVFERHIHGSSLFVIEFSVLLPAKKNLRLSELPGLVCA
jgi:hypothetical protein